MLVFAQPNVALLYLMTNFVYKIQINQQ